MSKGKKKTTSTGTSTTTQTLDPWSRDRWQNQYDTVQGLMGTGPVQAYSGPMVAGLSDREQDARGRYEDNMGSFNPAFNQAATDLNGAGLQADFGSVAGQYMNPYEQQVIDASLADITRMNEGQNAAMRGRAAASGAYGGSGVAVGQALNNEAAQRLAATTGSQLRYQGYNDARGYYGQDIDARERRALGTANLAAQQHGMNTQDIAGLDALGQADRGVTQAGYDANYNEFLRQREEEQRRIQNQMGLLGMVPLLTNSSGTSNSTSTETSSPGTMGLLGQGLGLASMFTPGGSLAGMFLRGAGGATHAGTAGANLRPGG